MAAEVPALKPAMTPKEIACLERYLAGSTGYLEFGCGGSTLLAVRSAPKRVWSVESDPAWMSLIRRHPDIAAAETAGRLAIWHADIGPTKAYGYPATPWWRLHRPVAREKWPNYYETIWSQLGAAEADLFLVDGRFRVASGLAVAARSREGAVVLVHDFTGRPSYASLLEVFDKVEHVRNLAVLVRKAGKGPEQLAELMRRYRYDPE